MTVHTANSLRPARRPLPLRATLYGLTAGLLAAIGGANAAQPPAPATHAQIAANPGVDPALRPPGAVSVSNIDFKRGDGGAVRRRVQHAVLLARRHHHLL